MKKLNQLASLVLFIFVAFLVSCEKETTIEEQASAIAQEVANIKEAKEAFLKQNKSINLLTGKPENLQAKGSSTSNYFIDWKNSKKVKFKKGVNVLRTPVIRQLVDKREHSFIASFKNDNKIEQRFFIVFFVKRVNNNKSFSGYISKFTIQGKFEALYCYKNNILITTYVPKKQKFKKRSWDDSPDDCVMDIEMIKLMIEMILDNGGGVIENLGCVELVAKKEKSPIEEKTDKDGFWHSPNYSESEIDYDAFWNHPVEYSFGHNYATGGQGSSSDTNDDNDEGDNKHSKDSIRIDSTFEKTVANCAYKLLKDNKQFNEILDKLVPKNSDYHVVFQVGESSGNGGYTNSNTDPNVREIYATISKDNLSNSIISIAESILHEAVHVRLFEQIKSIGGLDKLKEFSHLKTEIGRLAACYNKYGPKHNPSQHNFMWEDYVDKIAKGIETIHKLFPQNYEKVHEYMKGTDGYRKETFYKKVVQAGLSKTSYFKNIKGDPIKGSEHNKTQREILNMSSALKAYGKKIKNYKTCQ